MGNVVLVYNTENYRLFWRLGRISELIRNTDGHIQSTVLYTDKNTYIRREVSHLYPLELEIPIAKISQNNNTYLLNERNAYVTTILPQTS